MKILLESTNEAKNFIGTNEDGKEIHFSGTGNGVRPMQSVLMAAAACSSFDLEIILKKMKQDFSKVIVEATAERDQENTPSVFRKIHLHYKVFGNIKDSKVKKACKLSLDYCSVAKMLEVTAEITHSFEVITSQNDLV